MMNAEASPLYHKFSFHCGRRKINDGERTESVIKQIYGKRLTYDQLVNKKK